MAIQYFDFFVHLFSARTLHRVLEWRNHKVTWPHITVSIAEVINVIIKRINEASVSFHVTTFNIKT